MDGRERERDGRDERERDGWVGGTLAHTLLASWRMLTVFAFFLFVFFFTFILCHLVSWFAPFSFFEQIITK